MSAPAPVSDPLAAYRITEAPYYRPCSGEVALYQHAYAHRLPLILKGPTGCGKTRFVEYMAWKLGRPLVTLACNEDMTAADLVGRWLLDADGTRWHDGPLTLAVRQGAICYLDEVVEARKDTTVVLHPLADDRRVLPIERTGEELQAPPGFMLVVSYNPGYQHVLKTLKPSTRQRFVAMSFDFPPPEVEIGVVQQESGVSAEVAQRLVGLATSLRRLQGYDLEESVSTRLLVYAAKLMAAGMPPRMACLAALVEPLSDESDTIAALQSIVDTQFPA